MTTTSTIDSDRLALSEELYTLAEGFTLEANMWKLPEAKAECSRCAMTLADLARGVVRGNTDVDHADAFARAGATILGNVVATRRFFTSIIHTPAVDR